MLFLLITGMSLPACRLDSRSSGRSFWPVEWVHKRGRTVLTPFKDDHRQPECLRRGFGPWWCVRLCCHRCSPILHNVAQRPKR